MTRATMTEFGSLNSPRPDGPTWWRWYHYYFLLAVFDLVVVIAGLVAYHRALNSYELALNKLGRLHVRQRWVTGLRLTLVDLNIPGNQVFASWDVPAERTRFHAAQERIRTLLDDSNSRGVDLSEFENHLWDMEQQELAVFDAMERFQNDGAPAPQRQAALAEATVAMAAMDKRQAVALTNLTEIDQHFLMRVDSLLTEYGVQLVGQANIGRSMMVFVVVILLGMFWYGRKLQHTHERWIADQQAVAMARKERLAAVGELCAAVAHGIRNPLAAILSSAQLGLAARADLVRAEQRWTDIVAECRRLDQRVTRLLDFAAGSSGRKTHFDLREAVIQVTDEMRFAPAAANVRWAVHVGDEPLIVYAEREAIVQATLELLSNAVDNAPASSEITVTCRSAEDGSSAAEIDVSDEGPGIPAQIRDRVFELFFTTKDKGTGIGLAAAKNAVELNDGDVYVVPTHKAGATIRIRLALTKGAPLRAG